MSDKQKMKRLDEISEEIFEMAKEFEIEKKSGVFVFLRESVNNIKNAQKNYELNYQEMDKNE